MKKDFIAYHLRHFQKVLKKGKDKNLPKKLSARLPILLAQIKAGKN